MGVSEGSLASGAALEINQNAEAVGASGGLKGRQGSLVEHISGPLCCHVSTGRRITNSAPAAVGGLVLDGRSREVWAAVGWTVTRLKEVQRQKSPLCMRFAQYLGPTSSPGLISPNP